MASKTIADAESLNNKPKACGLDTVTNLAPTKVAVQVAVAVDAHWAANYVAVAVVERAVATADPSVIQLAVVAVAAYTVVARAAVANYVAVFTVAARAAVANYVAAFTVVDLAVADLVAVADLAVSAFTVADLAAVDLVAVAAFTVADLAAVAAS